MRFLWSSDHHTIHANTPTRHILGNLSTFLYKDHDLENVDMVFFGGDFFERLVERPNPDIYRVEEWVSAFLLKCKKHNVIPIWLEGTSFHDRGQPAHFRFNAPEGSLFEYHDTLCIQTYPTQDGLTVMYVPDNMGTLTPDDIWEKALQALSAAKLEKVDIIAFHAGFEFELHPKAQHKAHSLERWSSIVKYGIFAGHIHTPVQKGKLYRSGSFDRDKHGEEHAKGGYCVDLDLKKEVFAPVFWENKNALPYLTMHVTKDIKPEQLVKDIHAFIKKQPLPKDSHIRIMGGLADIVNPVVKILSNDYPFFHLKAENERQDVTATTEGEEDEAAYGENITLTKDNLVPALLPDVTSIFAGLNIDQAEALAVLGEFL